MEVIEFELLSIDVTFYFNIYYSKDGFNVLIKHEKRI